MLARRERGDRDLVVGVARGADVDDVDGRILDHVLPAGGVRGEAEALGGGLDRAGGAPGQSVQMRGQRQLDEAVRVADRKSVVKGKGGGRGGSGVRDAER